MLTLDSVRHMHEDAFRRDVLIPMFRGMGFLDVVEHHGGPLEQGKDITMWRRDDLQGRVNYSVVAKSKPITGRASGRSSAAEVVFQVQESFGHGFRDPLTLEERPVHHCIVACPHEVRTEAHHTIVGALDSKIGNHVTFLTGEKLWGMIEKHLGPGAALSRLQDAGALLDDASPHHRVTAQVSGQTIVLGLEAKHPDAIRDEPLTIEGTFTFPDDAAGREARNALEQHVKTGTPVSIPSAYVKELTLPAPLRRVVGDTIAQLQLNAVPSATVITADILFESVSGRSVDFRQLTFRGVRAGTDEAVMETNTSPLHATLRVRRSGETTITLSLHCPGVNVFRLMQAADFILAFSEGGRLLLRNCETGLPLLDGPVPAGLVQPFSEDLHEFVRHLTAIQLRTRHVFTVPDDDPTFEDFETAAIIADALEHGETTVNVSGFSATMGRAGALDLIADRNRRVLKMAVVSPEVRQIWGTSLDLGDVARFIEGLTISNEEVERVRTTLETTSDDLVAVQFSAPPGAPAPKARFIYLQFVSAEERSRYAEMMRVGSSQPAESTLTISDREFLSTQS